MARQLGPARLIAIVSGLLALYSFARVAVLFFEALSIVRRLRVEDEQLLDLCSSGQASGSAKMRDACLKAHAERASPIVFKAIVQAVSTAFKDFSDTVGSPFKLGVLTLFMISSVILPVMPWARMLMGQTMGDSGMPANGVHYIGYAPPADRRGRVRRKFGSAMKALRLRRHPSIHELDEDEDVEPGQAIVDVAPHVANGSGRLALPGWDDIALGYGGGGGGDAHAKWD